MLHHPSTEEVFHAAPQAPGFTVVHGSDGTRTEVYQVTPNSAVCFSQDRHGRETSGTIYAPYAVTPAEPLRLPPSSYRPQNSIYDRR